MTHVTGHCEIVPSHRPSLWSDLSHFMCRRAAPGCGRAGTAGTSSAPRTAMSRHARLPWQRSL